MMAHPLPYPVHHHGIFISDKSTSGLGSSTDLVLKRYLVIIVCPPFIPSAPIPSEYCPIKNEIVINAIGAIVSIQTAEPTMPYAVN